MNKPSDKKEAEVQKRSIRDLANTPLKRFMLIIQFTSYVLIPGSPVIGGAIGGILKLGAAKTGGLILGIFIIGEVFFYVSLLFLGKEIVMLVRDRLKKRLKRKKKESIPDRTTQDKDPSGGRTAE